MEESQWDPCDHSAWLQVICRSNSFQFPPQPHSQGQSGRPQGKWAFCITAAHGQYSHLWHLLSPAWWSIFHLLPKWIQFCIVPLRGGKKPKSTTKITCASPITILLVILSPTAARDPPLANSQTTHLFPGLCCETSFFKHNKSNSFMSWAIVDFSLWLQMGMVCTNKSPDLSAITNKRVWVKYLARNIFYVFSLTVHPKSAEWWLGAVRRHW